MGALLGLLLLAATMTPADTPGPAGALASERTLANERVALASGRGALVGEATFYGRGVMERVLANRLRWGHVAACEDCVGLVALEVREHLGKRVLLQRPGHGIEGPFLVVDCGRFLTPGRVVEVDWRTARRWGMRGPLAGVRVVFLAGS